MPASDNSDDEAATSMRRTSVPGSRSVQDPRSGNRRKLEDQGTWIPERKKLRKKRHGVTIGGCADPQNEIGSVGGLGDGRSAADVARALLENRRLHPLERGFAEDFFSAPATGKLQPGLLGLVKEAGASTKGEGAPVPQLGEWCAVLGMGCSPLLEGMGSKRAALGLLAEELRTRGWHVVSLAGYDANFWLPNCLRKVLEVIYPDGPRAPGSSGDAIVQSLHLARAAEKQEIARPICFVVHNMDNLPQGHQALLSRCVAGGVRLACSVESFWAPLLWDDDMIKDFNFCRFQIHTGVSCEAEIKARYPTPPEWSGLSGVKSKAVKESLAIVLRSLTPNHRELVQVLAEHQQDQGGRKGISQSELLRIAQDRMIASTATKLRPLINELKDHDIISEKNAVDGGRLYHLHHSAETIRRLAAGQTLNEEQGDDAAA